MKKTQIVFIKIILFFTTINQRNLRFSIFHLPTAKTFCICTMALLNMILC